MTWSAVCSVAPHSHPDEGVSPHLCISERKRPTPVRRRLSLTQAGLARDIPGGFGSASAMKSRSLEMVVAGVGYGEGIWGPKRGEREKSWLLCGVAQQVGCLQGLVSSPLEWDAGNQSQYAARR
ncbi:unnamed protein product [Clavelina lepadiformis]|uniref:Uncharacterized protein n=1 Tax=Clavelina lepadiformis TaxID=159417 RepID=A0ABP0GN00_CLALP